MQDYDLTLRQFIDNAFREDIGDGDHSTLACIPANTQGKAKLLIKDSGILAGVNIAQQVFHQFDPTLEMKIFMQDGSSIKPGDIVFKVEGKKTSILQTERLVLNIMQRMSGIATQTREYVDLLQGLHTKVLDTRKTTPGIRFLEKEAVKIGGGKNHRMGLFDMIMIKDNHIDFAGGIGQAISKTKQYLSEKGKDLKIEVEARSLDEVNEIMRVGGIHRIMLDNFSFADTREAVELIAGQYETESSGGITKETIRQYAECGVDYISVGALTHQVKSLDMSLKAEL
ncbi:MAG: carboxylating nicotinate-nucleotide diphosphorylase [Bacteroidales bacterium]|nr:carboxylating nicotinate-nucleotide diphosphorylase [Bacteroidales bacterium]MCF8458342.1 carboxylating nicotinate-nucleotide diphosphorylase [Bacteroidales bacterium]